jgi:hypothetical protein
MLKAPEPGDLERAVGTAGDDGNVEPRGDAAWRRRLSLEGGERPRPAALLRGLLRESLLVVAPAVLALMLARALLQYPRCVEIVRSGVRSHCSEAVNGLRAFERVTLGYFPHVLGTLALTLLLSGWRHPQRTALAAAACYALLFAACFPVLLRDANQNAPLANFLLYVIAAATLCASATALGRQRGDMRVATRLAIAGVGVVCLHVLLFSLIPQLHRTIAPARIVRPRPALTRSVTPRAQGPPPTPSCSQLLWSSRCCAVAWRW